jgi:MOSC domain-containing protein YiiM
VSARPAVAKGAAGGASGGAAVAAVSLAAQHGFAKQPQRSIRLLTGLGVEGDAHCGVTTQHLYRVRRDPTQPNLCQVHLLAEEQREGFAQQGFVLSAGDFGENILTRGLDLHTLPPGTLLRLGDEGIVEVTGERTPCSQIDGAHHGLQALCWGPRDAEGKRARRAGIMGIVQRGGEVKPGDAIRIELPALPHRPLPAV